MPRLRLSHWGSSLALHGGLLLALLAVQAGLRQPAPKSSEWDVAMVSSEPSAAPSPPAPEIPQPKAPEPRPSPREHSQPLERQAAPVAAQAPANPAPPAAAPVQAAPIAPPPPPEKPYADSAWLTDTLWGMMNGRKRYPLQARRMGLEGKVIIEAEIDEHGQIIRADIKQSAGSSILDQEALALLKSVTPLKVDRYRLAARTKVLIPVSYVLE